MDDKLCDQTLSVGGCLHLCQLPIGGYSVIVSVEPAISARSKRIFVAKNIKGAVSTKDDAAAKNWQSEYSRNRERSHRSTPRRTKEAARTETNVGSLWC